MLSVFHFSNFCYALKRAMFFEKFELSSSSPPLVVVIAVRAVFRASYAIFDQPLYPWYYMDG